MSNELEDDFLYLKSNGKFIFFRKNILVPFVRIGAKKGRYTLSQDTIILDWKGVNPSEVRDWLTYQCVPDSQAKTIYFLDNSFLHPVKTMNRKR